MATVLQWQSHVTDSTDRDTILGNIDFLESFAGAITGDDSLHSNFESIRKKLKDGTLKPTDWKSSTDFQTITTKLTESSSGKIKELDEGANKLIKRVGDAEGSIKSQGTRLTTAEGKITSHTETLSGYGTRLDTAEGTLTSHTTALGKKLDTSTFTSFKTGYTSWKSDLDKKLPSFASATELENVKTLLNKEVSHWTADTKPLPQSYTPTAQVKASTQPWGTGEDPERHIGDLCTVIGETQTDKGVSYRFVKDPSADSYKWLKVIDNDGILALNKHNEFINQYNQRQKTLDDNLAERDRQYKVTVTTQGSIKDGAVIDGTSYNNTQAIVHTAHVYNLIGKSVINGINDKLTWTINKGRKTAPLERTVTGFSCYVTADDFVKDGTTPHYYNIELNSNF